MNPSVDSALATPYQFEFRGKVYSFSRITQAIKGKLHVWLKQRLLTQGKAVMDTREYAAFRAQVVAGDGGATDPLTLSAALQTPEGSRFLLRCSLGDNAPEDDSTLDAMLETEALATIYQMLGEELKEDPKKALELLRNG